MSEAFERATERIYDALTGPKPVQVEEIIASRSEVIERFGPLFTPEQVRKIEEHEFTSFLHFRNNKHWSGLDRSIPSLTSDMEELREGLACLVDPSEPLAERATAAVRHVKGMGKATATAILQVARPEDCGVWNSTSAHGLKALGVWPQFERGATFGERYARINEVLLRLADAVGTDLWTLDALWGVVDEKEGPSPNLEFDGESGEEGEEINDEVSGGEAAARFGLEQYLQEFLRDNWGKTELAGEWSLYAEEGEPEAGFEYPVKVGYIDLLAEHREEDRWLVIELKRGQGSDGAVGQVLRYMGAVRRELADGEDTVEGLIIAHEASDRLRYAVGETSSVGLQLYDVDFHLRREGTGS
ncbi:endonuclease NucS domain-containing protein [Salinibacter grassmerensis]|uniref:endonuclease NucS domain-containing protein n=1 Tax=Salinibacter grassmerensis TaxID=3040353 RepID=UPI0021E986CF|nr:endonuclease NucS domain-containing protein [Salinibacter grassmerensis]